MKISRTAWIHLFLAIGLALAALFFIRLHNASGESQSSDSVTAGHRLAGAWCKECHAIDAITAGPPSAAPAFVAIANQPSTTELALKVFLRSSHPSMPNIIISPDQADDLVRYILSLKHG